MTGDKHWKTAIRASGKRLLAMTRETGRGEAAVLEMAPDLRDGGDEGDLAQVVIDAEIATRLDDLHASLVEQVSRALDQLKVGRYGYCEDCGEGIPAERMEFAPETTRCVPCQGRRERGAA